MNRRSHLILAIVFALLLTWLVVELMSKPGLAAPDPQTAGPITIKKEASANEALQPGQPVSFTITVSNTGTTTATNVLVVDQYPASVLSNLSVFGEGGAVSGEGGELTWDLGDLGPNQVWRATYGTTVASPFPISTLGTTETAVINSAYVQMGELRVGQSDAVFTVTQPPPSLGGVELAMTSDHDTIGSNGLVTFTLVVTNTTDSYLLQDVKVNHALDGAARSPEFKAVDILTSSSDAPSGPEYLAGNSAVGWFVGELGPNQRWSMVYRARIEPFFGAGNPEVSHSATLLLREPYRTTPRQALQPAPVDLIVRQTCNDIDGDPCTVVQPSDKVQHTISYTNTGESDAANVVIEAKLDSSAVQAAVERVTVTAGTGEFVPAEGIVRWQITSLAAGESGTVKFEMAFKPRLSLALDSLSTATTIKADAVEPVSAPELTPLVLHTPLLELQHTCTFGENADCAEARAGDTVQYTIEFWNTGGADATGVIVESSFDKDVLDAVVAQVTDISPGGEFLADEGVVRWQNWQYATLPSESSDEVGFALVFKSVLALGDVKVRNEATMTAANAEPASAPESVSFDLLTPQLVVDRDLEDSNGGSVEPGDEVGFNIRVQNVGSVSALDLEVHDNFQEHLLAISDVPLPGQAEPGRVVWRLDELKPDESRTFSYVARVKSANETTLATNQATVQINEIELTEIPQRSLSFRIELPPPTPRPATTAAIEEGTSVVFLVVAVVFGALLVTGVMAYIAATTQIDHFLFRDILEMFTIVIIVSAVLVLAIVSDLGPTPAVGVLSGIAGYVLGRRVPSGGGGSVQSGGSGSVQSGGSSDG